MEEVSSLTMLNTANIISIDELIPTYASVGLDLEWLEMSVMILNFSEAVTQSDYQLESISLISDILTDTSMWGWGLYDDSTVMITYIDETLMMRVTGSNGQNNIQTFYFSYNDKGEIEILRFDESILNDRQDLYIEDFVENTGLTVWSNEHYQVMTTYITEDGGTYVMSKDSDGNQRLVIAQYDINGVNVSIYNATEDGAMVDYDLSSVSMIDGFDLEGHVYYESSLLIHELETTLYERLGQYMLSGRKMLTAEETLSVSGLGIESTITLSDILTNINTLMTSPGGGYNRFDYEGEIEAFYESIKGFAYYDYSNIDDRVEQEIVVTVDYQFDGNIEQYVFYPSNMMNTPNGRVRAGYELIGYSLTPDGAMIDFPYAFTEDVTIYAIWQEIMIPMEFSDYFTNITAEDKLTTDHPHVSIYWVYEENNVIGFVYRLIIETEFGAFTIDIVATPLEGDTIDHSQARITFVDVKYISGDEAYVMPIVDALRVMLLEKNIADVVMDDIDLATGATTNDQEVLLLLESLLNFLNS